VNIEGTELVWVVMKLTIVSIKSELTGVGTFSAEGIDDKVYKFARESFRIITTIRTCSLIQIEGEENKLI
jgi:hypothetical protein